MLCTLRNEPDPRVAIITGASSGIGEATARALAQAGFRVALAARRAPELEALAKRIEQAGGHALPVPTDLCSEDQTRALVERTRNAFGRIDLLVNNAGMSLGAALEQLDRDELRNTFEVNLFGALQLCGAVAPIMRAQGGGRIVNVSSLAGTVPAPLAAPYAATKAALESATDCLRLELAPWKIDLALVVPGFVKTEVFDKAREWSQPLRSDTNNPYLPVMFSLDDFAKVQLERAIGPDDVAAVVVEAATARRPRARYYAPYSAGLQSRAMRAMPTRLRDHILKRIYKWK